MKNQFSTFTSLLTPLLIFGCAKENSKVSGDQNTPAHEEAELCILRAPETRLAGAIVELKAGQDITTVSNSSHGNESILIATFKSTDGKNDLYTAEIRIPDEKFRTKDISYEGKEIIIYQNADLVMLMRPITPKG